MSAELEANKLRVRLQSAAVHAQTLQSAARLVEELMSVAQGALLQLDQANAQLRASAPPPAEPPSPQSPQ